MFLSLHLLSPLFASLVALPPPPPSQKRQWSHPGNAFAHLPIVEGSVMRASVNIISHHQINYIAYEFFRKCLVTFYNCGNFAGLVTNPAIAFLTVTTMRQDSQRIIPVIQIPASARIFSHSSMRIYSVCTCQYLPV